MRLQTLLQAHAHELRKSPEQLKYLLAPVLAHSQEDQRKFYRLFDEYLLEIRAEAQRDLRLARAETSPQIEQLQIVHRNSYPFWLVPVVVAACILLSLLVLFFARESPHPIPNARFYVLNGQGDTLTPDLFSITSDTIAVQGNIKDSLRFYFDPGTDTIGMSEVELIWSYGDGTVDTLTERKVFFIPQSKVYAQEGTYFVQLMLRHPHAGLKTELEEEVAFFYAQLQLSCPNPLFVGIRHRPLDVKAGTEVEFALEVGANIPADAFTYRWTFGEGETDTHANPSYRYEEVGKYTVGVELIRKQSSVISCQDTARNRITVSVGSDQPTIELATNVFPLKKDHSGLISYRLSRWSIGLVTLGLTLLLLGLGLLIRYLSYKPIEAKQKADFEAGEEGPFSIQLPSQDHLIAADKGIYQLASLMRQRRVGNIQHLNLPVSIQATIKEAGMPMLHFDTYSRPTEYLLLIEQHHPQSHLARFFGRMTKILEGEDVLLESFYYDADPRVCWNEEHPKGISIEQLQQRYRKHRLIFFSTAHQLIDGYEPQLKPWFAPAFEVWRENRLILTPIPVVDWGYKERLLMQQIDLLPLDIPGQMQMIEMFDETGQPDFYAHKKHLLEQFPAAGHGVKQYDLESLSGLQAYLGPELFTCLAATTVYPVPTWEVTLAIAHALSRTNRAKEKDFLLTFENLLSLARIPWMQTCELPQRLRLELLNTLDADTERVARQVVLDLLQQVQPKRQSFASHRIAIQSVTNQFFLSPANPEVAQQMYYLTKQNKLADAVVQKRLEQKIAILDEEKGRDYLHNRFGFLRPREYVAGGLLGFFCISLISFLLYQYQAKKSLPMDWLKDQQGSESIWVHQHLEQDSALIWHNQAVEQAKAGQLNEAKERLQLAIDQRLKSNQQAYLLADSNRYKLAYRLGVEDFNAKKYNLSLIDFKEVNEQAEDSVFNQSIAGQALAYYHLDSIDQARQLASQLATRDSNFIKQEYPNLYAMLGVPHSYQYHIDLAEGFFASSEYPSSLLHADSALQFRAGDSLALYWRNLANSALKQLAYQDSIARSKADMAGAADALLAGNDFQGHTAEITSVAFSPNAKNILTGSQDRTARRWNLKGKQLQTFKIRARGAPRVVFFRNKACILSVENRLIVVKDLRYGKILKRFRVKGSDLMALTPNGQQILTKESQYIARLWDQKGKPLQQFYRGRGDIVTAFAFSPDGQSVLIGTTFTKSSKGTLTLWETQSGKQIRDFGNTAVVNSIAFSPTGEQFVTAEKDKTVKLWSLTGILQQTYPFDAEPKAVAYAPAGERIAIAVGNSISLAIAPIYQDNLPAQKQMPQKLETPSPKMVYVEGGSFFREVNAQEYSQQQQQQQQVQIPQKGERIGDQVRVSDFYLGKYELTVKEYMAFVAASGREKPQAPSWGWQDDQPILNVSWDDAQAYCEWLSKETGETYRLPTEAEWEYAARGGKKAVPTLYAGSNSLDQVGWYSRNSEGRAYPVGQKQANELGLYDLSGNVAEWCQDWYGDYPNGVQSNPRGPLSGYSRIIRGGSWEDTASRARVSSRFYDYPSYKRLGVGFRIVKVP